MAKILFVDDDELIVLLTRAALRRLGHDVCTFSAVEPALAAYAAAPRDFSLVICDVNLGPASGFELARAIRGIDPKARVLLVSGAIGDGDARRAKEVGALGVFPKTEALADLTATLARFLPG